MGKGNDEKSLKELDRRLQAIRSERKAAERPKGGGPGNQGMGVGMRIAVEIVAAIAGGSLLGYVLDDWLGTKPWLFLVFFFLGVGAAFMNVIRIAKSLEASRKADKEMASGAKPSAKGSDDRDAP